MEKQILIEIKEMNKTLSSIKTFMIAEAQLISKQNIDIQKIKLIMEKYGNNRK